MRNCLRNKGGTLEEKGRRGKGKVKGEEKEDNLVFQSVLLPSQKLLFALNHEVLSSCGPLCLESPLPLPFEILLIPQHEGQVSLCGAFSDLTQTHTHTPGHVYTCTQTENCSLVLLGS